MGDLVNRKAGSIPATVSSRVNEQWRNTGLAAQKSPKTGLDNRYEWADDTVLGCNEIGVEGRASIPASP